MIQRNAKRIVLFLPHRADPDQGVRVSADLLPLELLQIAAFPDQEGYEVVMVDAMIHEDYLERLFEACDGALLVACSCILGYQVAHGTEVARKLRQRFPDLPMIWGGWFPSVLPDAYLREGIADAVGLGQGELTFWDVVQAVANGEDLATVPGLAVLRDGEVIRTDPRPIVGFDKIPDAPWHLLDFEAYVELQNNTGRMKIRHKYPDPEAMPPGTPLRGFSYFSSFGCPEPCTFCCSPLVVNRRWKAIPGKLLAERILECHDRFNFNILRFQDANFGVAEKRSNEFCESLLEKGEVPFWWNATYEVETVVRYKQPSLDLLRDAKLHLVTMGAESGDPEQQIRIGKNINVDSHIDEAFRRLNTRGISPAASFIIGYPQETPESMENTIRVAARIKHRFPGCASDIFPFRPIPGCEDYDTSLELGYAPPTNLDEWGQVLEYKLDVNDVRLPDDILEMWRRYGATSSFYDGHVREGGGMMRRMMHKISGWRLKHHNYTLPIEQKLFDMYVRMTGQTQADVIEMDRTSGVTPNPVQS